MIGLSASVSLALPDNSVSFGGSTSRYPARGCPREEGAGEKIAMALRRFTTPSRTYKVEIVK